MSLACRVCAAGASSSQANSSVSVSVGASSAIRWRRRAGGGQRVGDVQLGGDLLHDRLDRARGVLQQHPVADVQRPLGQVAHGRHHVLRRARRGRRPGRSGRRGRRRCRRPAAAVTDWPAAARSAGRARAGRWPAIVVALAGGQHHDGSPTSQHAGGDRCRRSRGSRGSAVWGRITYCTGNRAGGLGARSSDRHGLQVLQQRRAAVPGHVAPRARPRCRRRSAETGIAAWCSDAQRGGVGGELGRDLGEAGPCRSRPGPSCSPPAPPAAPAAGRRPRCAGGSARPRRCGRRPGSRRARRSRRR